MAGGSNSPRKNTFLKNVVLHTIGSVATPISIVHAGLRNGSFCLRHKWGYLFAMSKANHALRPPFKEQDEQEYALLINVQYVHLGFKFLTRMLSAFPRLPLSYPREKRDFFSRKQKRMMGYPDIIFRHFILSKVCRTARQRAQSDQKLRISNCPPFQCENV